MKHLLKFTDGPALTRLVSLSMTAPLRKPVIAQQAARIAKERRISEDAAYHVLFHEESESFTAPGADIPVGLWFVKDDGVYLMTNAFLEPAQSPGAVYAQGYVAGTPGVWDRSRDAAGGDDFCEFIEVNEDWPHPIGMVLVTMDGPEMTIEIRGVPEPQRRSA